MEPIDRLPNPSDRRLAVRVTADALRHVRAGHPWIFEDSITSVSHDGGPGDLAVVFDDRRRFAAVGLYDPASPIRVKVLHHGGPETIDDAWFAERIRAAIGRRSALIAGGDTTGYRCVNGENDGLPALVVDRYAGSVVVKLYSSAWFAHLRGLVAALEELLDPERVVLRLARSVQGSGPKGIGDGTTLVGDPPAGPVLFRENGLVFEADVVHGQKTGHFLDQRDNRALVGGMASGCEVLDVFACTGGFSVYAAAGGAPVVTSVDLSGPALAAAARNVAHNRDRAEVAACRWSSEQADAFDALAAHGHIGRRHDVVVIDPPSFAQKKADVRAGVAAYRRLTRLGVRLVRPDGLFVQASCSSRISTDLFTTSVLDEIHTSGRDAEVVAVTGHAVDHPVTFREGEYLKALYVRLGPARRRR